LIGSNGAGKSSTLKALLNSVKKTGDINFLGYDTRNHKTHTLVQHGLSLVPEGRKIFINLTVEENLRMGAFNNDENYEHLRDTMYELFPRIKDKRYQLAGTMSGGEQQMLAISRALMGEPKLLMLDEPSLGLAPKIVGEVFEIIMRLRDEGITILLVEQNAFAALKIALVFYRQEAGRHQPVDNENGNQYQAERTHQAAGIPDDPVNDSHVFVIAQVQPFIDFAENYVLFLSTVGLQYERTHDGTKRQGHYRRKQYGNGDSNGKLTV
jgi:branched-chain amino acid transport system ATP-binding protein